MIRNKYSAKKCQRDEIKFPSLLERSCYDYLISLKKNGDIDFFLMQIPFHLPGNSIHRVDFQVFSKENVYFIEAKGRDLPMGKLKRNQVQDIFGVQIFVAKNAYDIAKILNN